MTKDEMIDKALTDNINLSRDEYQALCKKADEVTAAHGVEGEAPLSEEERERRMRMNFYGSTLNVMMAILAAIDDLANRITTLNNNILALGGMVDDTDSNSGNPA